MTFYLGTFCLSISLFVSLALATATVPSLPKGSDFAHVEHKLPLAKKELVQLQPKDLEVWSQEELDQLYARLTAGPIPNGPYKGSIIFTKDGGWKRMAQLALPKLDFKVMQADVGDKAFEFLKEFAEALWKGKYFYRNERVLRNIILEKSGRWLTRLFAVGGTDQLSNIPLVENPFEKGQKAYLLFPAKTYCGQSLLDSRKESVVIDYAFYEDVKDKADFINYISGRKSLSIRDEIRMVRPGFYLGRAYINKMFALNFVLYSESEAKRNLFSEDCWPNAQKENI